MCRMLGRHVGSPSLDFSFPVCKRQGTSFQKHLYHKISRMPIYEGKQSKASLGRQGGSAPSPLQMGRLPSVPGEELGGRGLRQEVVRRGMWFCGCNGLLGFGNCEPDAWAGSQCRALSEAPGWPHKGSALAGRRGKVSSDPITWREAPAHGVGSAVQGNGNEGGAPIAVLSCQAFN